MNAARGETAVQSSPATALAAKLRAGTRRPRDDQAAARKTPTCQAAVVIPISAEKTAVAV